MNDVRERLAKYAHDAWTGWMEYLFSKGTFNDDGTWTMPQWAVERWQRQAVTKYEDLPESEKDSDREEAEKILRVAAAFLGKTRGRQVNRIEEKLINDYPKFLDVSDMDLSAWVENGVQIIRYRQINPFAERIGKGDILLVPRADNLECWVILEKEYDSKADSKGMKGWWEASVESAGAWTMPQLIGKTKLLLEEVDKLVFLQENT